MNRPKGPWTQGDARMEIRREIQKTEIAEAQEVIETSALKIREIGERTGFVEDAVSAVLQFQRWAKTLGRWGETLGAQSAGSTKKTP